MVPSMGEDSPVPSREVTPTSRPSRLRTATPPLESLQIGGHCEEPLRSSDLSTPIRRGSRASDHPPTPIKRGDWAERILDPSKLPPLPPGMEETKSRERTHRSTILGGSSGHQTTPSPACFHPINEEEWTAPLEWLGRCMSKPEHFTGKRPLAWLGEMEIYFAIRGIPDQYKLQVALSFFNRETMNWYLLSLGRQERPASWPELKEAIQAHFAASNYRAAVRQLRRVKQTGTIQEYLFEFNAAAAECPGLAEEERLEIFIDGLRPELALNIRGHNDLTLKQVIARAVRMSQDPPDLGRERKDHGKKHSHKPHKSPQRQESSSPEYRSRQFRRPPPRRDDRRSDRYPTKREGLPRFGLPEYQERSRNVTPQKRERPRSGRYEERGVRSSDPGRYASDRPGDPPSGPHCFGCGQRGHMVASCPLRGTKN